jgi:hypothetical protein
MESFDEAAAAIAQQMLENLRHNVGEDKRRRAMLLGAADPEDVPVDAPFVQVSRCCK